MMQKYKSYKLVSGQRMSTHPLYDVRLICPHKGNKVRKTRWGYGCSLAAGLGLSHFLEPRRISRELAFVGWLLSCVKVKCCLKSQWSKDEHSFIVYCLAHLLLQGNRVWLTCQGYAFVIFWKPKRLSRALAFGG